MLVRFLQQSAKGAGAMEAACEHLRQAGMLRHSIRQPASAGVADVVHAHRTWKVSPACHAADSSSAVISLQVGG